MENTSVQPAQVIGNEFYKMTLDGKWHQGDCFTALDERRGRKFTSRDEACLRVTVEDAARDWPVFHNVCSDCCADVIAEALPTIQRLQMNKLGVDKYDGITPRSYPNA